NGADTHVTNATCNFEETRKAGADELLYSGKGAYKITSYGNLKLPLRSHVPGEYLLLTNVAYVPGFITNCVSLDKLTKANIHWSTKNPSILERDGDLKPFCYLYQSGSHWIFESPRPSIALATEAKRLSMKKRTVKITAQKAHRIIGHAGHETIGKLQENCDGIKIDYNIP
ncbi:hypothetical protein GcM1_076001, partial [Golovinomyces cichoracearum]